VACDAGISWQRIIVLLAPAAGIVLQRSEPLLTLFARVLQTMSSKKGAKPRKLAGISKSTKITNPARVVSKTKTNLRDKATINRLAMYSERAKHDKHGKFITGAYMSKTPDAVTKRIMPDKYCFMLRSLAALLCLSVVLMGVMLLSARRWFGNVHTVGQKVNADGSFCGMSSG
jgi:hypothetical protein